MYFIYFLYSVGVDVYYVGYTNDFSRRLAEHNNGSHSTFTSEHRPWVLKSVYSCGEDQSLAIRIERFIKKQKSRRLIEQLIRGGVFIGILAQLVRVPYVRD